MVSLNDYLDFFRTTLEKWINGKFIFIGFEVSIFKNYCEGFSTFEKPEIVGKENLSPNWNKLDELHEITLSLRDQILKETGKRIWGLTFTLYPDGKHEIEYDYNIPEGFNEKGEWIGEQDFGEVTEFFDNIRNIGTDEFKLK